jgi:hypothetical protein
MLFEIEATLLEHDVDFLTVRSRSGVEIDNRWITPLLSDVVVFCPMGGDPHTEATVWIPDHRRDELSSTAVDG